MAETLQDVDLAITGMTCASCANRVERKLNKVDGVQASVNYATEKANVHYPPTITVDDLVRVVEQAGYGAIPPEQADQQQPLDEQQRRERLELIVNWVLTIPVIVLSMVPPLQFPAWQWVSLALAAPVVLWGGRRFHRAAAMEARHGAASMDTLVSIGTLAAFLWSIWAMVFGHAGMIGMHHDFSLVMSHGEGASAIYLESAAAVTTFVLTGRYLEQRAKRSAGAALRELAGAGYDASAGLAVGDTFATKSGERVATDGVVRDGHATIDTSAMTGESVPAEVGPGDEIIGGTYVVGGRITAEATRVGDETAAAGIAKLVEQAQSGKANVQRLADRISSVFVPIVLALATITLIVHLLLGHGATLAFTAAVSVLVIACPCALGLATPTALLVGTGRGAQLGLLIRGPQVLEHTGGLDVALLDKTGTLTTGVMRVRAIHPIDADERDVLRMAAATEHASSHPIAGAVVAAAADPNLPEVSDFADHGGLGVTGTVQGRHVVVGRPELMQAEGVELTDRVQSGLEEVRANAGTVVLVAWDDQVHAIVDIADEIKPEAAQAVADLKKLGLRPIMLTGDHQTVAEHVAAQVGIDEVRSGVRPQDKADVVADLQRQGHKVAMIGDGVNDTAALAQADLGIAMGTGTSLAASASDLTVISGKASGVPQSVRLARKTLAVIKGNLVWAFAYNIAGIPLAMTGRIGPMVAGLAMAMSSLFVVTNSLRLRSFDRSR